VIEDYPQIRFFTEVRFDGKPFATMVAECRIFQAERPFDGMQGNFFSSATRRGDFANESQRAESSDRATDRKELVLRYAERQSLASDAAIQTQKLWRFTSCRRKKHLRIIGVVENPSQLPALAASAATIADSLSFAETCALHKSTICADVLRGSSSSDKPHTPA